MTNKMTAAPSMRHLAAADYRKKAKDMGMDIQIAWYRQRMDKPKLSERVVLICGDKVVEVETETRIHNNIDKGLERLRKMVEGQ